VFRGFLLLLAGWPVYIMIAWQRSRLPHPTNSNGNTSVAAEAGSIIDLTEVGG
jgi:hypothetical protein